MQAGLVYLEGHKTLTHMNTKSAHEGITSRPRIYLIERNNLLLSINDSALQKSSSIVSVLLCRRHRTFDISYFWKKNLLSSRVSIKGWRRIQDRRNLPMPWKRRGLLIQAVLRNSFACKAVFAPTHQANMQKEHSCCAAAQDKLGLYFKLGRQLAGTRQVRHGVCVFLDWKIFNWGIGLCNFFLE